MELIEENGRRASRCGIWQERGDSWDIRFNVNPARADAPARTRRRWSREAAKTIQGTPQREAVVFSKNSRVRKEWDVLDLRCGSGAVGISPG